MGVINNLKDEFNKKKLHIRYNNKFKKLGIKYFFGDYIIQRYDSYDATDILELIKVSSNKREFQKNIINYTTENKVNFYNKSLLIGNLVGVYNFYNYFGKFDKNEMFINNFDIKNKEVLLPILRKNFFEYVMNNNEVKNYFYTSVDGVRNFVDELNKDEIEKFFDDVILGKNLDKNDYDKAKQVHRYIFTIVSRYKLNDIVNNFDFVKSDLNNNSNEVLDDRREKYDEYKLSTEQVSKINNIKRLEENLIKINNVDSKKLLERLHQIDNYYNNIDEVEDIYLEYEILFREDLINHLYVPTLSETIIDDFRNVKPQLLHNFLRNPENLREKLETKIKEKIISERINGDSKYELTEIEMENFKKQCQLLDVEMNQAKVNYSFDSSVGRYSDASGFGEYISDTSNQLACSIYSEDYFNVYRSEMLGIGFNVEGLVPEAIVLSSPSYVTTNKGLNNLEYDENDEFNEMSACYEDLKKNDGASEIILFRRNVDYDTKASYIFVAYDIERDENYEDLIIKSRKLAKDNDMKLVMYDLYKIRESYKKYDELLNIESDNRDYLIEQSSHKKR